MEPALEPASENYPCPESCVCEIPVGWFVPARPDDHSEAAFMLVSQFQSRCLVYTSTNAGEEDDFRVLIVDV